MTSRITMLLAAAALALAAAACGSDESDPGAAGQPGAATQAGDAAVDGDGGGGDAAVDGDALALGARVVSPFVDYGAREKPTKVGVRVLEVRKGRTADLREFDLDREHRRSVPY